MTQKGNPKLRKFKVSRYHNNSNSHTHSTSNKESASKHESDNSDNEARIHTEVEKAHNRKLKCAKPDDTDIKKVVTFAHEKLDVKHVQNRTFDSLNFNMLMAGELEIIMLNSISESEKNARISIAKTLAYHKQYLQDADLREGYDYILKKSNKEQESGIHN